MRLLLLLLALLQPPAPVRPAPVGGFSWPLGGPHPVLRPFVAPTVVWGPGHRGVDLGGLPGDPVFAVADGTVVFAGFLVDRGLVSIDHAGGLRSTYEPVEPAVAAGDRVRRGSVIGHLLAGHPGCPAAACLHWGVRRGEEYLDPLVLVTHHHVRLLPWPR
jgi:murein DD-endopeptidase MepM/ murein hydrolase activator NlpD